MSDFKYVNTADLYDKFVRFDFDIPFWLAEATAADGDGSILELMCGTGRVTLPLIEAGHKVTALDISKEFIDALREKVAASEEQAPKANVEIEQADARSFDLHGRKYSRVIIPCHSFSELTTKEDQQAALVAIRKHLNEDLGQFICPLHNPAVRSRTVDDVLRVVDRFPDEEGGHLIFSMSQKYVPGNKNTVRTFQFYEIYDKEDRMIAKRFMENRFSLIASDDFAQMVEATGFKIDAVYGDYEKGDFDEESSPFMIFFLSCA